MKTVYTLMLAVSLGATIYFIDTSSEYLFGALLANLLALMSIGLYKVMDESKLFDTTEEEN